MNLKLALSVTVVAITAFSLGAKVNGQTDDPAPRKASLGLVGYMTFFVDQTRIGSPIQKAGVQKGDLIRSINDHTIETPQDLAQSMAQVKPGQTVKVEYLRYNAEDHQTYVHDVNVVAIERP